MAQEMLQAPIVDTLLVLKTAGLVDTSAAIATILDVGGGRVLGNLVIDVTAIEVATDEIYDIVLQGSPDSDFGTDTNIMDLLTLTLGLDAAQRTDMNQTNTIGRYVLPFTNVFITTMYRYLRLYTIVTGTIATGINYSARLAKLEQESG